jgi:3-dehydroquinate synthase
MQQQVQFPSGTVNYYLNSSVDELSKICDIDKAVFVTDEHIAQLYPNIFTGRKLLVVPAGEPSKDLSTISSLSEQLILTGAARNSILIGIGGGVVTDITGFLASVYMRGLKFGFVPTSLLAMVDAAIGGKNGVNLGLHKNILGTIRQPEFILYDTSFLQSLPDEEWSNGFAEIIKYACIFDAVLFEELEENSIAFYKNDAAALEDVIARCVAWKNKTVAEDEQEKGIRKLLNFGHTAAHAIENLCTLPHGKAVSIGMAIACKLSEHVTGLDAAITQRLEQLLLRYGLPINISLDATRVMEILKADKKRKDDSIDYILLKNAGEAIIQPLSLQAIENIIATYESDH